MSVWRYAKQLPDIPPDLQLTLGEGNTPLIRAHRIGAALGMERLWLKLEMTNPTGSYKDRFAAVAISIMLADGKRRCLATSSGNTGAALAAYCAAAALECSIAVVEAAPLAKLRQMQAYGAHLMRIRGFGLDPQVTTRTFEILRRAGEAPDAALQISAFRYSPLGMSGIETLSHELIEQADGPVDHVFCPAGGGGLALAVARGFQRLTAEGGLTAPPRVEVVQPEGNDTIATPLREGDERAREVTCTSRISGLQVPTVIDGDQTLSACRATGGSGHVVSDEEIWAVQQRLALEEGVFCEPAGAAALAGALQAARGGRIAGSARVVCLITGSGFKDPPSLDRMVRSTDCPLIEPEDLESLLRP